MAAATSADLDLRHATVRRAFDTLGLDALIVTAPANIRYLTNHAGSAGTLVATDAALARLPGARLMGWIDEGDAADIGAGAEREGRA